MNDYERAVYILKLEGRENLTEERKITDLDFLERVMETREEVDSANSDLELGVLKRSMDQESANLVYEIC